jgi:hypothetical protein
MQILWAKERESALELEMAWVKVFPLELAKVMESAKEMKSVLAMAWVEECQSELEWEMETRSAMEKG